MPRTRPRSRSSAFCDPPSKPRLRKRSRAALLQPRVSFIAHKAGLKGIGLHSLRHSHGSRLLSDGVSLPTVSKRLGHSSVRITAEVYAHAFTADEIAAAETWDKSMREVIEGPRKTVTRPLETSTQYAGSIPKGPFKLPAPGGSRFSGSKQRGGQSANLPSRYAA